jgi:hydroxypyruvate isomerase
MTAEPTLAANLRWLYTDVPFEQRFELAAQAGFRGVELPSPYEYGIPAVRELLSDNGLELVLVNTPAGPPGSPSQWGLASQADRVEEFRDGVRQALEYAVALDGRMIHVMGGVRPAQVARDSALGTYADNIGWAASEAAGSGVVLVLESINQQSAPGFVLESVREAAAVVQEVATDNVGVLFDVFHSGMSGDDVPAVLAELLPLVRHVQVADAPGRHEPGTGDVDWGGVFGQLRSGGYDGWVGCEYEPLAGTQEGLVWRERVWT